MGVEGETEMARERMGVAEQALDRVAGVNAAGAGYGVQGVHRLAAQLHGEGDVALQTARLPLNLPRRRTKSGSSAHASTAMLPVSAGARDGLA